ncbi:MAG: hypothetical protein IPP61_04295 [Cytophagaceae bacterium]|nr:hypothetical protein [Cytophagaceae bacterium]MBL0301567.1 hypothetical protein [Cytophagaceae bacterium]MBL0324391.1 hypothetical protein [Cytophagaceae bacterium]
MRKLLSGFILLTGFWISNRSFSQSVFLNNDSHQAAIIERLEVKRGVLSNTFHDNAKPFSREAIVKYFSGHDTSFTNHISKVDLANIRYLLADSWEHIPEAEADTFNNKRRLFKHFFKEKSDFYYYKNDDFDVHVNPIFHFMYGSDSQVGDLKSKDLFINTRGVEIRGRVNKKLGFYTMITENQMASPNYIVNFYKLYKGYPYQSLVKPKDEDTRNLQVDFFSAIGYITFKPMKSLTMSFGHDRNFIGSGIRSMVLSDFSSPYLQLKSELKLGKMQYLSILGQMTNTQIPNPLNSLLTYPPKYLAFHHLNFNIGKNLNLGLFESVMYGKRDFGFEFNYLNPVIFYRWIEGNIGSSDNAFVGADFKLNALKTLSFYGQYFLDEYNSKEFKKEGWWAKKYSWQLGGKYIDVFTIENLDFQFEHNRARPYIYSHFTTYTNYVNYSTPLAHPLGANFKESIMTIKYQPLSKLFFSATAMYAMRGDDKDSVNYGSNLLTSNRVGRGSDYNNFIGQGLKNQLKHHEVALSFMPYHNLFFDFVYQRRKDVYQSKPETIFYVALRLNMARRNMIF